MIPVFKNNISNAKALRFLIVGGLNTVVGLVFFPTLFLLLPSLQKNYLLLITISQVFCIGFSYLTNKYLVFQTKARYVPELTNFILFHGIHYGLNVMTISYIVEEYNISPLYLQPIYTILVIISSYFWHSLITFKEN